MRIRSLAFAGYRSFAARSPRTPERPLERLQLAPLTLLLGKNNSGKSTVARLLHHILLALGHEGSDPFPMTGKDHSFGRRFRDLQHNASFFNPVDLEVDLAGENGVHTTLAAQLIQSGDSDDDLPPSVQMGRFAGQKFASGEFEMLGLLPAWPDAIPWRKGARELLEASCYLGPIRDPFRESYTVNRNLRSPPAPTSHDAVAQLLLEDIELRSSVNTWMVNNLEGWQVDVQQNLDIFRLLARRGGQVSNLAASGQGIQQVLPVVALCCWRNLRRGSFPFLDIIEQPELHLHDAAHAALGDLLLSAVATGEGNVVVETHSESLVLRVRRRVAEGLSRDNVAIAYIEDRGEGSRLRSIPLRLDGEVEWWPEGVFSESFVEVKAIRQAQRALGGA